MSALFASLQSTQQRMWIQAEKPNRKPVRSTVVSLSPSAPLKEEGPSAMLIESSEGVSVVRNGRLFPAEIGLALKLGDRVVVPDGGSAQAVFQEQDGQAVLGTFQGGCNASLVYFSKKSGACSVVFDVHCGQVDLAMKSIDEGRLGGQGGSQAGRRAVGFHCYSKPIAGR